MSTRSLDNLELACSVCKEVKKTTEFYVISGKDRKDKRYHSMCKACGIQQKLQRIAKLRELVHSKYGGHCRRCGYSKHYACLEFHHLESETKEFNIGRMWCRTPKDLAPLFAELEKTVCLCCLCHRELHAGLWTIENRSVPVVVRV